ncbi:MAG: carboxylate--amine ligase, partial [Xanthobacteraceae bacterium]
VRGMGALAETCDSLNVPYRFFGFDSAISEVVNYAKTIDAWMRAGGRNVIAAHLGIQKTA